MENAQPDKKRSPGSRWLYWAASLALAAALLYYSFRGIEWARLWTILRSARADKVSIALCTVFSALFLRSFRWRVLLSAEGKVPVSLAFWATSAGYLGNNVLPARAGEVIRSLMISRKSKLSKTFVLTTALSERVADAIALITISAAVLLTLREPPGWLASAARPFAILGLCGAAAIALFPIFEARYYRILARVPVPEHLRERIQEMLGQGILGIRSFHNRRRLSVFLSLTAVIWCLDATTAVLCAQALGMALTIPAGFLLVAGIGLGSALPSTPGYVGIYQFVAVTLLAPFGFGRTDAIAFILLFQALAYIIVLICGLIGMAKQRAPEQVAATAEPRPAITSKG